jgi:hypothetical protein
MKTNQLAMTLVAALSAGAMPAAAATIDYSALIDLEPSMITSFDSLEVPLPGDPINIAVGDTLQGTISFANHGRITLFDNLFLEGYESFSVLFSPNFHSTAFSEGTLEFLGVEGELLGPRILTSSRVSGGMGFGKNANLTNTMFSFTGVRFSITYVDRSTPDDFPLSSQVTPARLSIPYGYFAISQGAAVPEPSTWAMMITGFGAIGTIARRSRRCPTHRAA